MAEMVRRDGDERGRKPPLGPCESGRMPPIFPGTKCPGTRGRLCLDGRIGLGSLINLIVLAVGLAAFFIRIDARVASLEDNFTEFKGDVKAALLRLEDKLDRKLDRPALAMPGPSRDATADEGKPTFLAPEQ